MLNSTDPNRTYEHFATIYKNTYEKYFPVKTLTRKRTKLASKLWITKGFIISIKSKCKLYKKFLRNPIPSNEDKYKKYKNKLNILLRISKRNFYDSKFESAKGNLRFTLKLLNEVIKKNKSKFQIPTTFTHNGNEINDPMTIANKFCEFFTNVGPNLAKKLLSSNISL